MRYSKIYFYHTKNLVNPGEDWCVTNGTAPFFYYRTREEARVVVARDLAGKTFGMEVTEEELIAADLRERLPVANKVTAEVEYGVKPSQLPEAFKDSNPCTVKLKFEGRSFTLPFFTGKGWTREPNAADVVECLLSDHSVGMDEPTFEEWCNEFGYDTDSRQAEKTFKTCIANDKKFRKLLGPEMLKSAEAAEDREEWVKANCDRGEE